MDPAAPPLSPLVGTSEAFLAFRNRLEQAARSEVSVLLQGESGTGKGVAARALHAGGSRAGGPFVVAHLAALAPTLVEGTLFGHERGAFTDAHRSRRGLFQRADGGTMVLDDVDLVPREVQPKLLRVLQEKVVEPLGAEAPLAVDVRIVATTNVSLSSRVESGDFRADLFYRLSVLPIEVPPLRSRRGDVPLLVDRFRESIARRLDVVQRPFSPAALERLAAHAWPGNVRELENAVERVLVLAPPSDPARPVEPEELAFLDETLDGVVEDLAGRALGHGLTVDELARAMMERALEEQRGNVSAAARQVGLTRRAFEYRMNHREGEE